VPVNAENTFLLFKERRPFKLKKEYPSEQWQIISFRLRPLKTPVSIRWTVPLTKCLIVNREGKACVSSFTAERKLSVPRIRLAELKLSVAKLNQQFYSSWGKIIKFMHHIHCPKNARKSPYNTRYGLGAK
jgi:hypothetical protein